MNMKDKINKTNGNKLIKNLFLSLFNKGISNKYGINGVIFKNQRIVSFKPGI